MQYLSIRYTERLEELDFTASVGSKGDSYDNAAAEALNRLFKTEVIRRLGPWRTLDHVEFEVLKWVDWYNQRRLHTWTDDIPPIEFENAYYAAHNTSPTPVEEERLTLHRTRCGSAAQGAGDRAWDDPAGRGPARVRGRVGAELGRQADIDEGVKPGVTSEEAARIKALEQENRELRRANEILKSASAFFAAELDRPQK